MTWAAIFLELLRLLASLIAFFRSRREREAGRLEAVLDQKSDNEHAIRTADEARLRARIRDDSADGLRADDGFRRD